MALSSNLTVRTRPGAPATARGLAPRRPSLREAGRAPEGDCEIEHDPAHVSRLSTLLGLTTGRRGHLLHLPQAAAPFRIDADSLQQVEVSDPGDQGVKSGIQQSTG